MNSERSKYLSYLLRHKPEAANLSLDKEGWCPLDQLLENTDFTLEELEKIVAEDAKGRYSFQYWEMADAGIPTTREPISIRANQGHSTSSVRLTFKKAVPPVKLFHGAGQAVLDKIRKDGLKPMSRHHVHLSADLETAEQVGGRRRSGYIILEVDAKSMLADGIEFFLSDNGVWLVDHVPAKYLKVIL